MLQHRDDEHEDEFDDVHASDVSSDEDTYYQTVAVGGRQGKLDCAGGGATSSHIVISTEFSFSLALFVRGTSLSSATLLSTLEGVPLSTTWGRGWSP